jgi:hypothetical protein
VLKDDRMMSMLTFVVIMIAIGTMIQRADLLGEYFGGERVALEFRRDEAIVQANTLSGIDVLANDLGLKDGDAEKLIIVRQPKCGRVFVRGGQAHYLPAERCAGSQSFEYTITGRSRGLSGNVVVIVRLDEPEQAEVAANAQRDIPTLAPTAPRATGQQVGETPALLAAQPSAGTNAGSGIVQAPAVPRPQAPEIGGLPDAASGPASAAVGGGGSAAPGVTFGGSGRSPAMTRPRGSLSAGQGIAKAPEVILPDPEAPAQPAAAETGAEAKPDAKPDPTATVALARIDPAATGEGDATAPSAQRANDGLDGNVPRTSLPGIDSGGEVTAGLDQPADALASVRGLGKNTGPTPVDTTSPMVLSDPDASAGAGATQAAAPAAASTDPANNRVAALPSPTEPCTVPPALILDVKPTGLTEVIIESPCHARTVAELSYDGLRFGVALDAAGAGVVAAVGLQQSSDVRLQFADHEAISFNIPFSDTERMDRVALVWEMPVDLELHAFEFGALPSSDGHVGPDQPRSHGDVRRRGGGYLLDYQPVDGIGQSISVYTYWRRHGGRSGVVSLKVDFATRDGRSRPDTCSGGVLAEPDFTVLRSSAGKLLRPRHRRLASLDCAVVSGITGTADRFIGDAVDDMIVLHR